MVQVNDMMSVEDVQEILAIPLIGVIPDDERVIVSTNRGEPLVLSETPSMAGTAFENVARSQGGLEIEGFVENFGGAVVRGLGQVGDRRLLFDGVACGGGGHSGLATAGVDALELELDFGEGVGDRLKLAAIE